MPARATESDDAAPVSAEASAGPPPAEKEGDDDKPESEDYNAPANS